MLCRRYVLISPCAPSRAVAISCASRGSRPMGVLSAGVDVFIGFASFANRRPRSKVYGVGRSTATSSLVLVFPAARDIVMVDARAD